MLTTSASQYLQPDYIQPLPSSLDVNNSPLALLAQTCSSIGKDPSPSSKTTNTSSASDKKTSQSGTTANSGAGGSGTGSMKESSGGSSSRAKSESPSTKNVLGNDDRSRSRPSGADRKESSSSTTQRSTNKGTPPKMGFRVPPLPSKETGMDRSNSDQEPGQHSTRDSFLSTSSGSSNRLMGHSSSISSSASISSFSTSSSSSSSSSGLGNSSGKVLGSGNSCSNMLLELNQEALSKGANQASLHGSLHPLYSSLKLQDSLQALHGGLAPSLGAVAPGGCALPPFLGYPLSLDPLAAAYSASLAAAAHCNVLPGLSSQKSPVTAGCSNSTPIVCSTASLSPYVSYARVKTATGATTLVPFCKDPYCAHCQLALHGAQLSAAAAAAAAACSGPGCSQCNQHDKSLSCSSSTSLTSPSNIAVPSPHSALSFYPGTPSAGMSTLCSHAAFGSAAAAAAAALHSPHGGPLVTPYVCNWVQGSDYCGKRFTSSEDLLQHLRSHTSTAAGTDSALLSPFNTTTPGSGGGSGAGVPLSALGFPLGNLLGCASQMPGVASLSPGLLSASTYGRSLSPNTLLAAARYHPYKPPPPPPSLSVFHGSSGPILPGALSLAAYYSPYAFYGHRLGAAAAAGP